MGKKNKIRYKSAPKTKNKLQISHRVFLREVDDYAIQGAEKGDLQVYTKNEALNSTHFGQYDATGFSGYFKVDIYDGRKWQPVLTNDIFTYRENHFSKKERPIDTYQLCLETLKSWQGKMLVRTYREHYMPDDEEGADDTQDESEKTS